MKKISEHLGEIIVALAGICLIVMLVVTFRAPIGGFFTNTINKLTGIGTQVLANIESPDFTPEPGEPEETPDGTYSYEWAPMSWNGENKNFSGRLVWTDGTNYYYSRAFSATNNVQYVLNQETNTWEEKTWEGCTWFMGDDVWTDGTNTYLSLYDSNASYSNRYQHYVLQDGKWVKQTWNYTQFTGSYIWNTKNFAFYCNGETQIALQNGKWLNAANAFTGLDSFFGSDVWTDGTSFFYSFGSKQYKLSGWNWEAITWEGLNDNMDGDMIWTDGENMYYSITNKQFKLNTETLTVEPVTWTGISDELYGLCGADVWTDGTNLYFSELDFDGEIYQYVRVKN